MDKLIFILDPPHGNDVHGKRSPDGELEEWKYGREFIKDLKERMIDELFTIAIPVREEHEIGLQNRIDRYDKIKKAVVISIHLNAAGSGSVWMNARGFEIWTSKGETKSDQLATIVFNQVKADFPKMKMRPNTWDPKEEVKDPDWEANLKVLMSKHPSMLIELGFQDNKEDKEMLQDPEFRKRMIESLIKAFKKF